MLRVHFVTCLIFVAVQMFDGAMEIYWWWFRGNREIQDNHIHDFGALRSTTTRCKNPIIKVPCNNSHTALQPGCYLTKQTSSHAATQELPNTLLYPKVHYRIHKRSLSWARSIQSIPHHPISTRFSLILSTHLRFGLPSGFFPSGFPNTILYAILFGPFVLHALPISSSLTWSFYYTERRV
jgi:hypothetical protein